MKPKHLAPLPLLALALPFALGWTPVQEQTTTLAYKTQPGQKITVTAASESKIDISGALQQDGTQSMTGVNVIEFQAEKEGFIPFAITVSDLKIDSDMTIPGVDMTEMLAAAKDIKTTGKINAQGQIKDWKVEGDPQVTAMMDADPNARTGFLGLLLPEKPVAKGESWSVESDIPASGEGMLPVTGGKSKSTFTLAELVKTEDGTIAEITVVSEADLTVAGPMGDGSIKARTESTYHFHVEKGMIVKIDQKLESTTDLGIAVVSQTGTVKTTIK